MTVPPADCSYNRVRSGEGTEGEGRREGERGQKAKRGEGMEGEKRGSGRRQKNEV